MNDETTTHPDNPDASAKRGEESLTRADNHAAYLARLGQKAVHKVSRLAQLARTSQAESRAILEEIQALRANIQAAEQEIHRIRANARSTVGDVQIQQGRIDLMKRRMAVVLNDQSAIHARAASSRNVLEKTLHALEETFGGGANASELFESMNWR